MLCQHKKSWSFWKWIMIIAIILLLVYLLFEHRVHLLGRSFEIALLGLVLLCPLMHLFMHHGHKHKRHDQNEKDAKGRKNGEN